MYDGGMFLSKSFTSEKDDGRLYQFAVVWGKLIKDAEQVIYNKKKTSFTLKYHTDQFQNVTLWGDSDLANTAASLEKGDVVLVCGVMTHSKYTVRNGEHAGEERENRDITPNIIIPQAAINSLMGMCGSTALANLINSNVEAPDAMESTDDDFMSSDDFDTDGAESLFNS